MGGLQHQLVGLQGAQLTECGYLGEWLEFLLLLLVLLELVVTTPV